MLSYRLGDYDLLALPIGVLAFMVFVPIFWLLPARWIRGSVIATGVAFAVLTWPPVWCVTFGAAVVYGYLIAAICQAWKAGTTRSVAGAEGCQQSHPWLVAFVWIALLVAYVPALIWPVFPWLPDEPIQEQRPYYWIAWLGLAFLALRIVHVAVDVSCGKIDQIRLIDYLAYVLFTPVLRMGPLMRFDDFAAQLGTYRQRQTARNVCIGFGRIGLGFVNLAIMQFVVYALMDHLTGHAFWGTPQQFGRPAVFASAMLAPFLIYFWMSGCYEISIGLARMMGFVVPENFRWPWRSTSIREFWKRFHITMGAWLFDYIYIPLGGNRRHVFLNYALTFLVCSVWHGFFVSYLMWGLAQGVGLYVNRRWHLCWVGLRERGSPLYDVLRRWHLVGGRLSWVLSWGLTSFYQVITITLFMDEGYANVRWIGYLLGLYDG
jgi:alginate O-acetyltransferase complex protein AlgI